VPPAPKRMVWRVTEAPWRMERRPLCYSCAALSWFCGLVSSPYLISMRWMSHWRMLRSLGRRCLGKVDLLVAGGAAEVLPVPLSCPLPLLRIHPPSLLVCCFLIFVDSFDNCLLDCSDAMRLSRTAWVWVTCTSCSKWACFAHARIYCGFEA
jgi:hypothetical protein